MSTSLPKALDAPSLPSSLLLVDATLSDAIELARRLLGEKHIPKIHSSNHPDLHILEPEGKGLLHPIANIQELIREMGMPPFESSLKIFVIVDAEKMLPAAANALLKALEEPNPDTFFLLLTEHPNYLLPTILSRVCPISFPMKDPKVLDMTPFVGLAQRGEWDLLLDSLDNLEGEEPDAIFHSLLLLCAKEKDPQRFINLSKEISDAKRALDHHFKLKAVILHLLLPLSPVCMEREG